MNMNFNFFKKHSTVFIICAVVLVILTSFIARTRSKKQTQTSITEDKPLVKLLKIQDFSESSHSVSANGTVESVQQVDLKSQASGKVTKLNVKVGQHVRQGDILLTIDQGNAGAALTSARGALAQAEANYNKLLAGASSEQIDAAKVNVDNASANLASTKASQDIAVQNAKSALLNTSLAAIPAQTNQDSVVPTITGSYNAAEEGSYKITVYSSGTGLKFQASGLETVSGDVKSQPIKFGTKGLYIQFSSDPQVSDIWTINIPNTYSPSYLTNYNAYMSALKTRESAVTAAQGQLNSAQAALAQLQAQARPADLEAAKALILTAQGQVQAAEVAFENTVIRAPFEGEVSSLAVKFADLVSPGQKIATVVNKKGQQIKVFVSSEDLPFVKINSPVQIGDNNATGTVSNLASSVDANSRTGEVDITVANAETAGLTVGQNVAVKISSSITQQQQNIFILPLQAVKLTPDQKAFVYSVDSSSKAKEIEVKIEKIDGESVTISGDLSGISEIISNAYDVSSGDVVLVQ